MWRRLFRPRDMAPLIDTETGLPSIEYLIHRLGEEISRSRRHDRDLLAMVVELVGYTSLAPADQMKVLAAASAMLGHAIRRNDTVAHLGDGRFALLLTEARPEYATQVAIRLAATLAGVCNAALTPKSLRADFGLAVFKPDVRDAIAMLALAEMDLLERRDLAAEARSGGAESSTQTLRAD